MQGEPHHIKLYNLPQKVEGGILLKGFEEYIAKDKKQTLDLRFHHLDGMYSVCTVEGDEDRVIHLSASTPLLELGNDEYQIEYPDEDKEDKSY